MSKKIKLFSTETEREAYENVQSYQSISTTLSEDTDIVHYDSIFFKTGQQAQVGDIMLDNKLFVNPDYYDLFKNDYEAIGIVAIEKGLLPDKKGRVVSKTRMSISNPSEGSSSWVDTEHYWGADGAISELEYLTKTPCIDINKEVTTSIQNLRTDIVTIPKLQLNGEISYYTGSNDWGICSSPYTLEKTLEPNFNAIKVLLPGASEIIYFDNALADFDGKTNTEKIMKHCTVEIPVNSNSAGNYPAAHLCTLYSVGNLDWYLPALGELAILAFNQNILSKAYEKLHSYPPGGEDLSSSTLCNQTESWWINLSNYNVTSGWERKYKIDTFAMAQF